jgi:hypothetical protein
MEGVEFDRGIDDSARLFNATKMANTLRELSDIDIDYDL